MFKLLDVKTYLNKWSVQSDKRIGRIMCHYLLMNIYHIKENVLHLWELYVGFQNLVQEKNKTHVDLSFGLQFMIEIIHD